MGDNKLCCQPVWGTHCWTSYGEDCYAVPTEHQGLGGMACIVCVWQIRLEYLHAAGQDWNIMLTQAAVLSGVSGSTKMLWAILKKAMQCHALA